MRRSLRTLQRYRDLIPELLAGEALDASEVETFPHLNADGRRRQIQAWRARARISIFAGMRKVPAADVGAHLAAVVPTGSDAGGV